MHCLVLLVMPIYAGLNTKLELKQCLRNSIICKLEFKQVVLRTRWDGLSRLIERLFTLIYNTTLFLFLFLFPLQFGLECCISRVHPRLWDNFSSLCTFLLISLSCHMVLNYCTLLNKVLKTKTARFTTELSF